MTRARRWVALSAAAAVVAGGGLVLAGAGGSAAAAATGGARTGTTRAELGPLAAGQGEVVVSLTSAQPDTLRALAGASRLDASVRSRLLAAAQPTGAPAVQKWAAAQGFSATAVGSTAVDVRGPAAALATAFGTTLGSSGQRTGDLAVPAAIAGVADAATGLDTRALVHPLDAGGHPGYGSAELAAAYNAPTASTAGAGVTIASVQFQDWNLADVDNWASSNGITPHVSKVTVTGETPPSDSDGSNTETALDVEALLATAPGATQLVYDSGNDGTGITAVYSQLAADAAAHKFQVLSTSWGVCEPEMGQATVNAVNADLQQIAAAGVTIFAASGDAGSSDCYYYPDDLNASATVDFPASSPYVVGVGGTSLTVSGSSVSETAWSGWKSAGSGGGVSQFFAKPAWQTTTAGSTTMRTVPDVASDADPNTGFAAYINGEWDEYGGTSLAAPTVAGYVADALSATCATTCTTGYGDIHSTLYANPSVFRDITSGNNHAYSAGAGYDLVTGLGSPNVGALTAVLNASGSTTAPTATASAPGVSTPTATATASATPTAPATVPVTTAAPTVAATTPAATATAPGTSVAYPAPLLIAPARTDNPVVPLQVVTNGVPYAMTVVVGALASCPGTGLSATVPTSVTLPAQGANVVTLVAWDQNFVCHQVTTTVVLDSVAPVGAASVTPGKSTSVVKLAASEPASWFVTVEKLGRTPTEAVEIPSTSASSLALALGPGAYLLVAVPTDAAGNLGHAVTATWVVPTDDRSLKRSGSWGAGHFTAAYGGTVTTSSKPGSKLTGSGWGTTLTVAYVCSKTSGVLKVQVDGKQKASVDLSCSKPAVRTFTVKHLSLAQHAVTLLVAAGKHGKTASVDDISLKP